jgi:hypothetical protein
MQSLNEELQIVNAQFEQRNRALSQANDDMQNLLNSTEIATVFPDDKLAIKRFTNMPPTGRRVLDIAARRIHVDREKATHALLSLADVTTAPKSAREDEAESN